MQVKAKHSATFAGWLRIRGGFPSVVIKKVELSLTGSCSDLVRFIEARGKREENSSNYLYHINGSQQECPELTRHPKTS